jgi:3'(2'), 5'-bisphosphate nucleotidase
MVKSYKGCFMIVQGRPLIDALTPAMFQASSAILKIYQEDDQGAVIKKDGSPQTKADRLSEDILTKAVMGLGLNIPIVGEETTSEGINLPLTDTAWYIDPLDGTKEFLAKTGDFTINVGLCVEGRPVLGLLYAPVHDIFMAAAEGTAYSWIGNGFAVVEAAPLAVPPYTAVTSRFYGNKDKEQALLAQFSIGDTRIVGSSLKFCLLALGQADIYARLGRTMLWDTAAGEAILTATGGTVHRLDGTPLPYHTSVLTNDNFFARRKGVLHL